MHDSPVYGQLAGRFHLIPRNHGPTRMVCTPAVRRLRWVACPKPHGRQQPDNEAIAKVGLRIPGSHLAPPYASVVHPGIAHELDEFLRLPNRRLALQLRLEETRYDAPASGCHVARVLGLANSRTWEQKKKA